MIATNLPQAGGYPDDQQQTQTPWPLTLGVIASAITSISTLAGLVFTLFKERRESKKTDLELRRMEIELERAGLELEALRQQSTTKK